MPSRNFVFVSATSGRSERMSASRRWPEGPPFRKRMRLGRDGLAWESPCCLNLVARTLEIRLNLAFELDRQRLAVAVDGFADGDADPAFGDGVFLDIVFLDTVEADADA